MQPVLRLGRQSIQSHRCRLSRKLSPMTGSGKRGHQGEFCTCAGMTASGHLCYQQHMTPMLPSSPLHTPGLRQPGIGIRTQWGTHTSSPATPRNTCAGLTASTASEIWIMGQILSEECPTPCPSSTSSARRQPALKLGLLRFDSPPPNFLVVGSSHVYSGLKISLTLRGAI